MIKLQFNQGWESILKKVKNKSIFDKSQKTKEKVNFDKVKIKKYVIDT